MRDFTWGDTVKLTANAAVPAERRCAIAAVCGIRNIETEDQARTFRAPIGSKLYLVEFADGDSVELPEGQLEPAGE
jgi:hypothetical protein